MKVGLFFGTFNPVHVGHLIIANYMADFTDLDEVWLVISPQNPLKEKELLLNEQERLHLANLAVEDSPNLKVSDIEFGMPMPSFTVDTLKKLTTDHPDHKFSVILGSDNLLALPQWKEFEYILEHFQLYVYSRRGFDTSDLVDHPNVNLFDVLLVQISASEIRSALEKDKSVKHLLHEKVHQYIIQNKLFVPGPKT